MRASKQRYRQVFEDTLAHIATHGFISQEELLTLLPDRTDAKLYRKLVQDLRKNGVEVIHHAEGRLEALETANAYEESDMLRLYLDETSHVPLLSAEEERQLALRIRQGRQAQVELLHSNFSEQSARKQHLEALVADGLAARDHLIRANTRLVVSCAKKYIGRGVPLLDLIQEGNLGLMKAVEKYDVERGFRFSTYATWWIRQMISRAVYNQARTIRLPVHLGDRICKVYRALNTLEQRLGRTPTRAELAAELGMEISKLEKTLRSAILPLSLDEPLGEDEENERGIFVEDHQTPGPIQSVSLKMMQEEVQRLLDTLPPREALVLRLRYGLWDGVFYTLEEVGQKFGLTRERIRQIEMQALRRLRQPWCARQLKEHLG